jgi:V8-like Glu-specific endopeptidase
VAVAVALSLVPVGVSADLLNKRGEAREGFPEVAKANRGSVFMVGLAVMSPDGQIRHFDGITTGFAARPDVILTSAHGVAAMVDLIRQAKQKKVQVQIVAVMNGRPDLRYPVVETGVHPEYRPDSVYCKDVGHLRVEIGERPLLKPVKFAPADALEELVEAYPIAVFGFPRELMDDPYGTAAFQVGAINSIVGTHYLRHNAPTSAGSGGSPVFNERGEVVASTMGAWAASRC